MRRLLNTSWILVLASGCNGSLGAAENHSRYAPFDTDQSAASSENTTPHPTPSAQPTDGPGALPQDGTNCGTDVTAPSTPQGTSSPPTTSTGPSNATPRPSPPSCEDNVGAAVLRRLTQRELNNTVSDALGVAVTFSLPRDPSNSYGFSTTADTLLLSSNTLEPLQAQVHTALSNVDLSQLRQRYGGCSVSAECDQGTVLAFAAALARRPLSSEETARYRALWTNLGALESADAALRGTLEAAALSPHALYRSEVGSEEGDGRTLDAYEVASALAYTFAASAPDVELRQAADDGSLTDPQARLAHAQRLLGSERGQAQALDFFRQWWRYTETEFLAKDSATYPAFTPDIQQGLVAETDRFVRGIFASNGTLAELLLNPDTELDPALASFYGLAATTDGVARYNRLEGRGIGLLAQGSVLARWALPNSSSPTQRGAFIRRSLLCEVLPAPPPNIGQIPEPVAGVTTRMRYESVHAVNAGCKACHQLTDPIGFAFEHFDGAGQFRQTERDLPIDTSGELVGRDVSFDGQEELARALAELPDVRDCLARHWVSFSLGVNPEQSASLAGAQRCAYESEERPLPELFASYAVSSHFARRSSAP